MTPVEPFVGLARLIAEITAPLLLSSLLRPVASASAERGKNEPKDDGRTRSLQSIVTVTFDAQRPGEGKVIPSRALATQPSLALAPRSSAAATPIDFGLPSVST